MNNFVEGFLKVTDLFESPTSYFKWAAYTALATVMRDNLWSSLGALRHVYPNLYVLLVGDSAATRKSIPLKAVVKLIRPLRVTKLIEGRASIQGVLNELGKTEQIEGRIIKGASALLYSEEFSSFLVKDPQTSDILTDLYDYKEEHSIILRSQDKVTLKSICVTMLSATNAAFMPTLFTKEDLYGGLVGRTLFILEESARKKNSGLRDPDKEEEWKELSNFLVKLSTVKGKVVYTRDAQDYYDDWYNLTDFRRNESKTGFEHRAHTHVLKLAMILAAAEEGFDRIVEKKHIEQSIDEISELAPNYKRLVTTIAKTNNPTAIVVQDIMAQMVQCWLNEKIYVDRAELLRLLFGRVDLQNFNVAMETLVATGLIDSINTGYRISIKGKEMFLQNLNAGREVQ